MSASQAYWGYVGEVQDNLDRLDAQMDHDVGQIEITVGRGTQKIAVQTAILILEGVKQAIDLVRESVSAISTASQAGVPGVFGVIAGFSNGVITDVFAPADAVIEGIKAAIKIVAKGLEVLSDLGQMALGQVDERMEIEFSLDQLELGLENSLRQQIVNLDALIGDEGNRRIALHTSYDAVIQSVGRYEKALAEGGRVLSRRNLARRQSMADVQGQRYQDMAFRIFRNDALQKYKAQFDLAQRYVYMTAKAYDYETTLLSEDPRAGQQFLTDIVRERQLGIMSDGVPQTGVGLADVMARMGQNFDVLYGQLGFNNPQTETNRFSLRTELFRIDPGVEGDANWREILSQDYDDLLVNEVTVGVGSVDNLWGLPEFRRFAVPPAGFEDVEPGIVIRFGTEVTEGRNFFRQNIGGLDNAYDATQFATKIRSAGMWFSNYDFLNMSNTPRVYLIPTGIDALRSPTDYLGEPRTFTVLDQVLPVPFPIGDAELNDPGWIPSVHSLGGEFTAIRRFGRLRAYHDSGEFSVDEVERDSRLVGRSVWNTGWMVIIPASTLSSPLGNENLNDTEIAQGKDARLQQFINGPLVNNERDGNGVSDIKLFFETYAYPRLKK
jgi:hypothetical protein